MADDPLFEFAVPDDLLREAVSQAEGPRRRGGPRGHAGHGRGQAAAADRHPADLGLRPPGPARPPPRSVPGTFGNGINLIGQQPRDVVPHVQRRHSGAVAFIAQVSQLLWAVPLAVWADRGSRKVVAAVALLIFAGFGALMAISPNVWAFAFLYLAASVGTGVNNTVHNSYLADAYPTEGAGPDLQLAQPVGPALADGRDPDLRLRRDDRSRLALRLARGTGRHSDRIRAVHASASPRRGPTRAATSSRRRAWTCTPSRRRRPGSCSAPP